MTHGETVATFEREFAAYVGARYAIAMTNGTVTMEVALRTLGVGAGDRVATTPLTMAATSIAILNVGAAPSFVDVTPNEWVMSSKIPYDIDVHLPVDLYGLTGRLRQPFMFGGGAKAPPDSHTFVGFDNKTVFDAAQTLAKHVNGCFTSYSLQRSKILNTGEGGMLVTNDEALATLTRSISSLGYHMEPRQPRIDSAVLKSPDYARHVRWPAMNARMNDATAALGLERLAKADDLKMHRRVAADCYRQVVEGCDWITPQHVPVGWQHDYWCYAVALADADLWHPMADAIVRHGGERPYAAWRLTYQEPAFRHLAPDGTCPVAENLQPRLMQFQTNTVAAAAQNARALRAAISEIGGRR